LSATATDSGSGLSTAGVSIYRSPAGLNTWTLVCTDTSSPYSCSLNTSTIGGDGLYDFQATAVDVAGNTGVALVTNRLVDNTAPSATSSVSPASPNANGWYNGSVTVTITATDGGSGVDKIYYTTDGSTPTTSSAVYTGPITLTADGSNPVKYLTVDRAGNQTTGATAVIKIDNTAPAISALAAVNTLTSKAGAVKPGGSYYVYANVSDGTGSGVNTVTANAGSLTTGQTSVALSTTGGPWTVDGTTYTHRSSTTLTANTTLAEGSYSISVTATDNNTNTSTPTTSTVIVDKTAPTTAITCPTGSNGVHVSKNTWQACTGGGGFTGTASDGTGSGAGPVEVQIQRGDGKYWDGINSWVTQTTWLAATGTTSWSYGLSKNDLTVNSSYMLSARATDNAGNGPGAVASLTFTYDG